MKKTALILCAFLLSLSGLYAQDAAPAASTDEEARAAAAQALSNIAPAQKAEIEVITETDSSYTMTIEYQPVTKEARFTYTGPSPLFQQGNAMNTIKARISDFLKERGYYNYNYTRPDMTKYDNVNKTTSYTTYIRMY